MPECSCCRAIKGKGLEVRLRLLQTQLARCLLAWIGRHQWANGELRKRDRGDERFDREDQMVFDPLEQDDCAGVEDASVRSAHND